MTRDCGKLGVAVLGALLLAGSGWLCAGETPTTAESLAANTWVSMPDTPAFRKLNERRTMLSQVLRPKGSDWILIEKGPLYNASSQAVWIPDLKIVIMIIGSPYSNPPCNTYSYDPASTEKVAGTASGWRNLNPSGDRFNGRMLWSSLAYDPVNREVVLFGGTSADSSGSPGTRVYDLDKNTWKRLDFSTLPLAKSHAECDALRVAAHLLAGRMRSRLHLAETAEEANEDLAKPVRELRSRVSAFAAGLPAVTATGEQEKEQAGWAGVELDAALAILEPLDGKVDAARIAKVSEAAERLRAARDWLAVEPSPRALTSMAFDPASKKIFLFGGDHLDYLMSDTWAYDCGMRRWRQLRPKLAPEPRAGHALVYLPKSNRLAVLGGFDYRSAEGYHVAPYTSRPFDIWTYVSEKNEWALLKRWPAAQNGKPAEFAPTSGRAESIDLVVGQDDVVCAGVAKNPWDAQEVFVCRVDASVSDAAGIAAAGVKPGTVVRHTGKFLPSFWDEGVAADASAAEKGLKELPVNKWVDIKPPKTFGVNRDWGTATYDTDRQQILWFSGGHCAYSGTDVSVYSTRANAWRISSVSDFPLGAWANTGQSGLHWSFEGRPFMHSHTYKLYAYDPKLGKMLLYNRGDTFIFNPAVCEWEWPPTDTPFGGGPWVPKFCTTPDGVMVWAPAKTGPNPRPGLLWRFDPVNHAWIEIKTTGGPLPSTPGDDWGTIVYDSKRRQVLMFTAFGKSGGALWTCETATGMLKKLEPANPQDGPGYVRESVYLPGADLVLFQDVRAGSTVVYDVNKNRFRTVHLPDGFGAKNPSIGLMWDPKRSLVWAVDANWNLKVLRFDPARAQFQDSGKPKETGK